MDTYVVKQNSPCLVGCVRSLFRCEGCYVPLALRSCWMMDHSKHRYFCPPYFPQALKADVIARQFGGRVIMCDTHEPPQRSELSQIGGGGDGNAAEEADDEGEQAASLVKIAKAVGAR